MLCSVVQLRVITHAMQLLLAMQLNIDVTDRWATNKGLDIFCALCICAVCSFAFCRPLWFSLLDPFLVKVPILQNHGYYKIVGW